MGPRPGIASSAHRARAPGTCSAHRPATAVAARLPDRRYRCDRVEQLQVSDDLFADAAFGQQVGEKTMGNRRLGRKLAGLQRQTPGDHEAGLDPLRAIPEPMRPTGLRHRTPTRRRSHQTPSSSGSLMASIDPCRRLPPRPERGHGAGQSPPGPACAAP